MSEEHRDNKELNKVYIDISDDLFVEIMKAFKGVGSINNFKIVKNAIPDDCKLFLVDYLPDMGCFRIHMETAEIFDNPQLPAVELQSYEVTADE